MKKIFIFVILNLILILNLFSQSTRFEAWIEQNGRKLDVRDNTVFLNRDKFKLVIKFYNNINYTMVNISDNSTLYDAVKNNLDTENILSISGAGMAEYDLNPDKGLWITDSGYHYLYYDNDKENRFNEMIKADDGIICKRIVEKLEYVHTTKKIYDIKSFPKDELYLVFISYDSDENYNDTIKQIYNLKLVFM